MDDNEIDDLIKQAEEDLKNKGTEESEEKKKTKKKKKSKKKEKKEGCNKITRIHIIR